MALYDKQELVKMAEEAIKRNNLFFVNDIIETFGNENSNGNALYLIVMQWAGQRK